MESESELTRKYYVAGESILTRPLFDQDFAGKDASRQSESKAQEQVVDRTESADKEAQTESKKEASRTLRKAKTVEVSFTPEEEKKVYRLIKDEYLARRGVATSVGAVRVDPKMSPAEVKKLKDEEAEKRAKPLMDFWLEYFVSFKSKGVKEPAYMKTEKQLRTDESVEGMKAGEREALVDKIRTSSKSKMKAILLQGILGEIESRLESTEKSRVLEKEMKKSAKMEEEKSLLRKALKLHYGFEREVQDDKQCMENLIWTYREVNNKFPSDGAELLSWWSKFERKKQFGIDREQKCVQELVDDFYCDEAKLERMVRLYKERNRNSPKKADDLVKYWKELKVASVLHCSLLRGFVL